MTTITADGAVKWAYGGEAPLDALIPALAEVFANHPMDEIHVLHDGVRVLNFEDGPSCDPIFGCGD